MTNYVGDRESRPVARKETSLDTLEEVEDSNRNLLHDSQTQRTGCCNWGTVRGLLLCQLTSILICGTAVFSNLLVEEGVDTPTLQSFGNYLFLALIYTSSYVYHTPKDVLLQRLKESWWKYIVVALFDVEGNYLMVKAYQYTSITSVQLLDSVTIPVVLILSWFFLKYRYQFIHLSGVVVAVAGMGIMIYADASASSASPLNGSTGVHESFIYHHSFSAETKNGTGWSTNWLGDLLAVLGATCYGFSNVGQEYFVNSSGQWEFLAALGFFGSFINGVQFCALELGEAKMLMAKVSRVYLYIVGFNLCLFSIYSIVPKTLQLTSAAVFNISILTSDFYTFMFGLFLFHLPINFMYFLAYILVICGITIYSFRPVPNLENG